MDFDAENSFEDMLKEYLTDDTEQEHNTYVTQGTVVHVGAENVLVDIGMKSEGVIPVREFQNLQGEVSVQAGDTIDVLVTRKQGAGFSLSYTKVKEKQNFEMLSKCMETEEILQGTVQKVIKGGFLMEIKGAKAFLPGSHVGMHYKNPEELIGKTLDVVVIKLNKKRNNIIVSHKVVVDKKRESLRNACLETLCEGAVIKGVVKTITDYGAFIDVGGIDGLLHLSDISWKRAKSVKDVLAIGDELEVKVLSFNPETQKLALGLKQLSQDPWADVEQRYPVGTRLQGKVANIVDYGAFVEMDDNIEGLVHISEMSWTRKLRHPQQLVKLGDIVDVVVLDVNQEKRRIALGMKQVKENPWDIVEQSFPIGTILESPIKNITDFGLFVAIEDGIDGLIHISDISWVKKVTNLHELYAVGDLVQAQVTLVDKENEKFILSIKELEPNPWDTVTTKYPVGTVVEGTVSNITSFGLFVKLEEGLEGLVHISEIDEDKAANLQENFSVGDPVEVQVIHITVNDKERKLGLSMKRNQESTQQRNDNSYNTTLGDMFADKFKR